MKSIKLFITFTLCICTLLIMTSAYGITYAEHKQAKSQVNSFASCMPKVDSSLQYDAIETVRNYQTKGKPEWLVFNEEEVAQLRAFLEIKDENGIKNGEKLDNHELHLSDGFGRYDPNDPWTYAVWWNKDGRCINIMYWDNINLVGDLILDSFLYLEAVRANNNKLSSVYVSNCPSITSVYVHHNRKLENAEFTGCDSMVALYLSHTSLIELDLSTVPSLKYIEVINTALRYLDISECSHLANIWGYNGGIQNITYGDETIYLYQLIVERTGLDFSISHLPYLTNLSFYGTNLKSIDISDCYNLGILEVSRSRLGGQTSKIEELSIADSPILNGLLLSNNRLTTLDISPYEHLAVLEVDGNSLSELDISKNPLMNRIIVSGNPISELDISDSLLINEFKARNTYISKLDFSFDIQPDMLSNDIVGSPIKEIYNIATTQAAGSRRISTVVTGDGGYINMSGNIIRVETDGKTFLGWYDENGKFLTNDTSINLTKKEYNSATVYEARFEGAPEHTDWSYIPEPNTPEKYDQSNKARGYNQHDYEKIRAFLAHEDEFGATNLRKIRAYTGFNDSGDLDDPLTWTGFLWNKEGRLEMVSLHNGCYTEGIYLEGVLDLSGCTDLKYVIAPNASYMHNNYDTIYSSLNSANFSGCTKLETVTLTGNRLMKSVNVDGCNSLKFLNVGDAFSLKELDVSGCPALESLCTVQSGLTSLDLSKNVNLKSLYIPMCKFTELDLSANTALEYLDINRNAFTGKLNLGTLPNLEYLSCSRNAITELKLTAPKLEKLYCRHNAITQLDISEYPLLKDLFCEDNQLNALEVTKNTKLKKLQCGKNKLTELDLENNPELLIVKCEDNQITALDLSKVESSNFLTSDFTNNPITQIKGARRLFVMGEAAFDVSVEGKGYVAVLGRRLVATVADNDYVFIGWYDENDQLISRDAKCEIPQNGTGFTAKFVIPQNGDCNMDGTLNTGDAVLILKSCANMVTLDDRQTKLADMNADKVVNTGDAVAVLKRCADVQ